VTILEAGKELTKASRLKRTMKRWDLTMNQVKYKLISHAYRELVFDAEVKPKASYQIQSACFFQLTSKNALREDEDWDNRICLVFIYHYPRLNEFRGQPRMELSPKVS
jgi:hypothetical protein